VNPAAWTEFNHCELLQIILVESLTSRRRSSILAASSISSMFSASFITYIANLISDSFGMLCIHRAERSRLHNGSEQLTSTPYIKACHALSAHISGLLCSSPSPVPLSLPSSVFASEHVTLPNCRSRSTCSLPSGKCRFRLVVTADC